MPFVSVFIASTFVNTMNNVSPIIASTNEENAFIQVTNIGGFTIDLKNTLWNNMLKKKLPKYKNRLDAMFSWPSFHIININITSGHDFNNLQNYLTNIIFVVDRKSIPSLTLLGILIVLDFLAFQ